MAVTLADLTPAQRDAAIDGFVADYVSVLLHVVSETRVYPDTPTMDALLASWARHEIAEPEPVLAKAVAWTLFMMQWNAKYRRLTAEEQAIHAAACRLSDAIYYDKP